MSVPAADREAIAARQVNLTTGGHKDSSRCYVLIADFWRSSADMCQNEATHRVCVDTYSTGMTTDGVFYPATTETRVCGEHHDAVRRAPGFRWSHELARVVRVDDQALARIAEETGEPIEIVRDLAGAIAACAEEEDIERRQDLAQPGPVERKDSLTLVIARLVPDLPIITAATIATALDLNGYRLVRKSVAATMTVRVRDRSAESPWGVGLTNPVVRKVTISAHCPTCGGKRGEPRNLNQADDGAHYSVDIWKNPCGHDDSYEAVVKEARALAAVDSPAGPPAAGDAGPAHQQPPAGDAGPAPKETPDVPA